jgi:cell division protein FtsX
MMFLFIGLSIGLFAGLALGILLGLRIQRKYQAFLREVQQHRNTQVFSRYYITEEGILNSSRDYSEF